MKNHLKYAAINLIIQADSACFKQIKPSVNCRAWKRFCKLLKVVAEFLLNKINASKERKWSTFDSVRRFSIVIQKKVLNFAQDRERARIEELGTYTYSIPSLLRFGFVILDIFGHRSHNLMPSPHYLTRNVSEFTNVHRILSDGIFCYGMWPPLRMQRNCRAI